jgi:hypothetical protein
VGQHTGRDGAGSLKGDEGLSGRHPINLQIEFVLSV